MRRPIGLPELLKRLGYGAKGSLFPLGADNVEVELPVGADGEVPIADASEPSGWRTGTPPLPPGGTTGQVLTKQSNADDDADWEDPTGGGAGNNDLFNYYFTR